MTRVEHPRTVPRNLRCIAGCALLLGVVGGAQHPFVVVLLRVFAERHHAVDERRENQQGRADLAPHDDVIAPKRIVHMRVNNRHHRETPQNGCGSRRRKHMRQYPPAASFAAFERALPGQAQAGEEATAHRDPAEDACSEGESTGE